MYELIYIASPNLMENDLTSLLEKVRNFIYGSEGHVKNEKIDQKRKLAYPIKKNIFGYYITCDLEISAEKIDDLQKNIESLPEIIRYLIINKKDISKDITPLKHVPGKPTKKEKVKIEELDKKLEELLKE